MVDEKIENKNKNEDVLAKDRKEKTPEQANSEIATIMPTMIDESENLVKVKDLSSIIPQSSSTETSSENNIELISKDTGLKGDGAITIANIDENGEALVKANFSYPAQIDVEARKEEYQRLKQKKKKREKLKPSKVAQKFQNGMALTSLLVIIFLAGFYYWYKTTPTEEDFQPINITIELGEKLPIRTSSYVKPGKGEIDELLYAIDTSEVILEEAGSYNFTVTYKGISKNGTITIQDTTEPLLEVREVTIVEGTAYNASTFVESCVDWSGCNYSFQDSDTQKKYTTPGSYVIYVVATDAYKNSITKKASLIIEAVGNVKTYIKESGYLYDAGYSIKETYEIHYYEYAGNSVIITGSKFTQVFTYQDAEKYEKARKTYNGEVGYVCNDSEYSITYVESIEKVGNNYSKKTDIELYLFKEGYKEVG